VNLICRYCSIDVFLRSLSSRHSVAYVLSRWRKKTPAGGFGVLAAHVWLKSSCVIFVSQHLRGKMLNAAPRGRTAGLPDFLEQTATDGYVVLHIRRCLAEYEG
jgi:hypothetical protein